MDCKEAHPLMHEYLDGELEGTEARELKMHLLACPDCRAILNGLERTEAMVRLLPKCMVPDNLTSKVMNLIPEEKKRSGWLRWMKLHPALSVASIFLLVMISSFLSLWNQDQDMVVKGANLDQVVIRGDTVYVPEGHTVQGDLTVKRGKIQVDGDVKGNLVVIDGSYQLASTAHISGQIRQVDQAVGWLWYKINEFFSLFSR